MKTMWDYLNVPLKATQSNGYDIIMASEMLGIWTPLHYYYCYHLRF
ncbi:hypothetical protein ABNX05_17730 [Lysinibacillus sp. M3]|uniref:Uncharacterized protein n=1 Tax=Lysinibacillus zambalensis TaxID=3160866 RepID=A0ABV1MVE1_9BACI